MAKDLVDQRGWITRLRRALPNGVARALRDASQKLFRLLPDAMKYRVARRIQGRRLPYRLVGEGDRVVQVGAPRDILLGGRSRAVHFAHRVGAGGHVVVVEPDPSSAEALDEFLTTNDLAGRVTVVNRGAWRDRGTLHFLVFSGHPAANRVLADDEEPEVAESGNAGGKVMNIPVESLADILDEFAFDDIRLVSVTTNGSEREILAGLWQRRDGVRPKYISLGPPSDENITFMSRHGYTCIALDDRGQLFERERQIGRL